MARIPYPEFDDIDERLQSFFQGDGVLNIMRMMAHAPNHADAALRLSDAVLRRSEVDPVLRQIGLLRLCTAIASPYERVQHETVSEALGMPDELVAAACEGSSNNTLDETQKMVCRLAEDLAAGPKASEAVFHYLSHHLTHRQFVELVMGMGFYLMQSRLIETFELDFENPRAPIALELPDSDAVRSWRRGGL